MLRSNFKLLGLIASLAFVMVLAACSDDNSSGNGTVELGGQDIEIPYVGAGSTARSLVLAEVLEDVGYNVRTVQVEADGPMYASTAENSDTLHASGWFPSTHKVYLDKYGDNLEVYEDKNFIDKALLSLAVPEYMDDVDSIEDLKGNEEIGESVDWTIIGIDPRTGIMKNTEKGLEDNDLDDWKLQEGSEWTMISKLKEKYENEEPIIITGWESHWIFKEMDLKMLSDPDKIYGGDDHINLVFNKDFKEEHPAAYKIATRMADDWSEDDENELMERIFLEGENEKEVVKDFIDNHSHRIDKWKKVVKSE